MKFLLDTDVCVDYLRGRFLSVVEHLQTLEPEDVAVSAIAVAELRYGADKSARPEHDHGRLDQFLEDMQVLDFETRAAAAYGGVRTQLEDQGLTIGPNDMLIASQALASGLVLVTNNVDEFARVEGLSLENWRTED